MNKSLMKTAIILPLICLISWVIFLQYQIMQKESIRLYVSGYDPRDILSGHYLSLQIEQEKNGCSYEYERDKIICQGYAFKRVYQYYLEEEKGKTLERMLAKKDPTMELEFTLSPFVLPQIKSFYIDGQDWKEWYKEETSKEKSINNPK